MPYIDTDYVDAMITEDVRTSVFTDNGVYNTAAFTQIATTASQLVLEAAKQAGFTLGDVTGAVSTDEMVKMATFGQMLIMMDGRRGFEISQNQWVFINKLEEIRTGKIPLAAQTPSERDTVGAASFTSSDPDDSTGIADGSVRVQVLRTLRSVY